MNKTKKLSKDTRNNEVETRYNSDDFALEKPNFGPLKFKEITLKSGETEIDIDTNTISEGLRNTTGTCYAALGNNLLLQVVAATCEDKKIKVRKANAVSEALSEIGPRDGLEGMLAAQMVAVHNKAMDLLSRANNINFIPKIETCLNLSVKLLRTFTAQMEALKKYRTGGHQKVTVEHVNVHKGGQAIVGNVNHERGGGGKNEK